jgi:hypothetical protein
VLITPRPVGDAAVAWAIKGVSLSLDTLIYSVTMIEVGFQAILFALLSRAYAVQEGLFPKSSKPTLFDNILKLERGIILGGVLIVIGFLLFLYVFSIWESANFGPIDIPKVTPIVIGSSISLSLGFEIILSSFLLSNEPGQSQPDIGNHRRSVGRHGFGAGGRSIGATGEGGIMTLSPTNCEALLDAARELVPAIVGARDDIERERCLPSSLVDAMRNAQLFELWLPKTFGGPELHPIDFLRVVEELSRADGSAGWCATVPACAACWRAA